MTDNNEQIGPYYFDASNTTTKIESSYVSNSSRYQEFVVNTVISNRVSAFNKYDTPSWSTANNKSRVILLKWTYDLFWHVYHKKTKT